MRHLFSHHALSRILGVATFASLILTNACTSETEDPPPADGTGNETGDDSNASTDGSDGTQDPSAGDSEGDDSTGDDGSPTDDSNNTDETTPDEPLPLGEQCEVNDDCESGKCKVGMIGGNEIGVCSDCLTDEECVADGKASCGLDLMLRYYVCQTGELGDECSTDEQCMDALVCAEIQSGFSTCSECKTDAECTDAAKPNCTVSKIDPNNPTSVWRYCEASGSAADGEFCEPGEKGDELCENYCDSVTTPLGEFGVCGECRDDADCEDGKTCTPASITTNLTGVPSVCE